MSGPSSQPDVAELRITYESVRSWYLLARALHRGIAQRRGLPLELVLCIFREAEFLVPYTRLRINCNKTVEVASYGAALSQKAWFATAPLTLKDLRRVVMMRLQTESHDQGWASMPDKGSWTWFDVGIASPDGLLVTRKQDERGIRSELRWSSHFNTVASSKRELHTGKIFGPDHEIWSELREGQNIVVLACARFGGWRNSAYKGRLSFWKLFEPRVI